MIHLRAIDLVIRPIIHIIILIYQPDPRRPIIRLLRPITKRRIPRIPCQPRPDREETPIRNRVLVIIPRIKGEDLPLQPAATRRGRIPPRDLRVKHALCERQPGEGFRVGGVGEFELGGLERGEAPEGLVVVAFGLGLVARHEVAVVARLVLDREGDSVVVGAVARLRPVGY